MKSLFALLLLAAALAASGAAPARPNIVLILSDDMGYSDLGCYGGEIRTPTLDSLATNGLRFTQFYNTARCCPTRASLLTGLYPHQAGIGHMMEDKGLEGYRGNLNRRCLTIAEALKSANYRSYAVGKWHVTPGHTAKNLENRGNWPLQRGFDRYYGTIHGAGSYWDPSALVRDNALTTAAADPDYQPREYYYTDAIGDQAVRFLSEHARDHARQPFFLYAAFTAAHWPMHARPEDIARYQGRYDAGYAAIRAARLAKQRQLGLLDERWTPAPLAGDWAAVTNRAFEARCMEVYAAMVDRLDQAIGRIVAELKRQGQFENTLVLFLQDNGACAETVGRGKNATPRADRPSLPPMPPEAEQFNSVPKQTRDGYPVRQGYGVMPGPADTYVAYGREWANVCNTPFREYKHWVHEGGVATPLIAHWPARIAPARRGAFERTPAHLIDIMATCRDLSGAAYPAERNGAKIQPLEGVSLRPLFEGRPLERAEPLFFEHEGNRAVRQGRWKLVAKGPAGAWELYDMDEDRTESRDLSAAQPAKTKELIQQWETWARRAGVIPWIWEPAYGQPAPSGGPRAARGSSESRFDLPAGAELAGAAAPDIARRAFSVTVTLETPGADGVLVAQGGSAHGWGLYLKEGALVFATRRRGALETVRAGAADLQGARSIRASLEADGMARLTVDGREAASRQTAGLLLQQPVDGLQVGRDLNGAVGEYETPFVFRGRVQRVLIELAPR